MTDHRSESERTDSRRNEAEADRLDRNFSELLQELRVLQAGMQILFAFLLSLAFASRFDETTSFQRGVYIVTLIFAALATACFIAPVPFHRFIFRRGMKDDLIVATSRYMATGLVMLFVSMCGAILVVLDFLIDLPFALAITGGLALVFVVLWVVLPIASRIDEAHDRRDR